MMKWIAGKLGGHVAVLILGIGIGQGSFGDISQISVGPLNVHMLKRHIATFTRSVEAIGRGDYRGANFRY
jgi:hypothetical protein